MKNIINWKVFFILLGLCIVSVFAVFPYVLTLQGDLLKQIKQPIHIIFILQLVQSTILFSISIFCGLLLAKKTGFEYKSERNVVPLALGLGIFTAISIFSIDKLFTTYGATISTSQNIAPVWQKLLAAFYGGITEEVLMRLFLMTLLVWIGVKIFRLNRPSNSIVIASVIVAAVIFGLSHLPITAALTTLTPAIIIRAIVLNGIGGIVFGWLYWKKGLGAAILAHFTTDIFLLTLLPLFFG